MPDEVEDSEEDLRTLARSFDSLVENAAEERRMRQGIPADLIPKDLLEPMVAWSNLGLIDAFLEGGRYPDDRIAKVSEILIDLRLQIIITVGNLGILNELYFSPIGVGVRSADSASARRLPLTSTEIPAAAEPARNCRREIGGSVMGMRHIFPRLA